MVSWPATRNVSHWATMLWSGRRSPCLSVPTSMCPSRSVPGSPLALRSARIVADRVVHELRCRPAASLGAAPQLDRDGSRRCRAWVSCSAPIIAVDEGVLGVAVERVEAVAEPAERDRVEGQAGHVGGDVDRLVRVQALPLQAELLGDVDHRVEVALHRPRAEAGQQDVVRRLPQRVVGVGGEQARALVGLAELPLADSDELVEAGCRRTGRRPSPGRTRCSAARWGWSA